MTGHQLHHVGHVVRDAGPAIASYRRMGFHLPAPVFPALPDAPDGAVGPGNTHIQLKDNSRRCPFVRAAVLTGLP
jgi:hypothetical protein